jgi:3-phosphoshikimate 1-carboxyvinyltransferase
MIAVVTPPANGVVKGEVILPASKSISNRVLIIKAICESDFSISNLSDAADTLTLRSLLESESTEISAGEGGTTLRFLLAYLSLKGNQTRITASESLLKRPVAPLVDALRSLGADIVYEQEEGRLPVSLRKSNLTGNSVTISGEISSQFISALMMIGPGIKGGLVINITGEVLSVPYILMTQSVMQYFGATISFSEQKIRIQEGVYRPCDISIEGDWSAASYWYEIAALSAECEILLKGLSEESLQGDAVVAKLYAFLGVHTRFTESGAVLTKMKDFQLPDYFSHDFSGCPDLGPAIAATTSALNITSDLNNLKNFRLKESDRAVAMQRELYNFSVKTDFCGGSRFKVYSGRGIRMWDRPVNTYNDHRVAMAFAPLCLKTGKVAVNDPDVVKKSYPGFWSDLKNVGFKVDFLD